LQHLQHSKTNSCNIENQMLRWGINIRNISRSTFATSAQNSYDILVRHLKHVGHTLATYTTNPTARRISSSSSSPARRPDAAGAARRRRHDLRARLHQQAPVSGKQELAPLASLTSYSTGELLHQAAPLVAESSTLDRRRALTPRA
jgi:hypothetical protein